MTLPYSVAQNVFDTAILTATVELRSEFQHCKSTVLELISAGFTGTIDIKGCQSGRAGWVNVLPQISFTTATNTTPLHYRIKGYWYRLEVVMTRSAGSVTLDAVGTSLDDDPDILSGSIGGLTIGATSTLVIAANPRRLTIDLINNSDENIYVNPYGGAAVMNQGILLNALGGSMSLANYKGAIYAICASGSKVLCYAEAISV